ncbi:hypothetical protein SR39_06095 [Methylobacterium radiotolerans]|nr:hypothetical protein SR39_06095 [Methylobacterium radiotolerans]
MPGQPGADGKIQSFLRPDGTQVSKAQLTLDDIQALAKTGDASGATAVPSPTAPAGTLARAFGDLSGMKAPGSAGFARLDGLYFTAATRALFNSPAVGDPTNWLGNGAGGSADQYAYGGFGQGVFLSGIGDVGVVGATRTTDIATSGRLPIGVQGWAFNFKTDAPQTAWAGYFEARRKKGAGQIHGLEINVTDLGDGSDRIIPTAKGSGPQAAYAAWTSGLNLAAGGNITPGQQTGWDGNQNVTQAANVGAAMPIYSNGGAKFEKGIIVAEGALVGCDGSGGANVGTAFELCRGAQSAWIDGSTRQAAKLWSDISPTGTALSFQFTDYGFLLGSQGGGVTCQVISKTTDASGVQIIGGATGAPARLVAAGTANSSLSLGASGSGVVQTDAPLVVNAGATFVAPPKLPSYTVGTLPTAGTAGRVAYCANARALTSGGTIQAAGAGTGAQVTDDGTAWRVAGTNISAQA